MLNTNNHFYMIDSQLLKIVEAKSVDQQAVIIDSGNLLLSDRPSLGIDVNEEVLLKHPSLCVPPKNRAY